MSNLKKYFLLLITFLWCINSWGAEFFVKQIDIEGLQRISKSTVYNYLPIKAGQMLNTDDTANIIRDLYRTGFFDHITLSRVGNTLIIKVVERPTIGQLKISGNSVIHTDKLLQVMKTVNIAEGRVYDAVVLEKIKQSLLNQYYQLGRYNARVNTTVTPMGRNRVSVNIDISEGLVAKVRQINIIGNHAFSNKALAKQLELTTPGILTIFTETDRYSQEKLDASLEKLRNYYLDRGYLKFAVKSSQVAITPDRKSIFLTIVVDEGPLYTIKDFTVVGTHVLSKEELKALVPIKSGDVFSKKAILDGEKKISDALGNKGYIFTTVNVQLKVDEPTKQVFLTFHVETGKRAYVRHISFSDNAKTNDVVLRREVQQMEAAIVSTEKLEESKRNISLLPFIKDVQMSYAPVSDEDDKVDVNYKVVEHDPAEITFSVGYSQLDHFLISAGMNQKNFLGTGKTLGLNFSRSRFRTYYGISYTDPYYTSDGISRSINLSISRFDPRAANVTSSYTASNDAASVVYSIPIGQDSSAINRLQLGYGYENTVLYLQRGNVSNQVNSFVDERGTHFQQLYLIGGVSRDARDKAIFPTKGSLNSLGLNLYAPITGGLKYYTATYDGKWYHPLNNSFIVTARGEFGYGNAFNGVDNFPFFKNYYAGGPGSGGLVRGYTANTLGPRDSLNYPTGGNLLAVGGMGLIFPNYVSENLRTSVFVDGGNVYNTFNNRKYGGTGSGPLRYSTGVQADWLTPFGLIDLSFAKPLNAQPGDNTEYFQFSLGANFG